ncbi:hypothetical protein [Echinicola shivajiensis]|uniref:hypothetical protein n=1 Tax=Echinicola shivajiensis TaxID=1035916 RepID=UPI001BFC1936|nr:hypothetical protein [Echinicola shivajiensis]
MKKPIITLLFLTILGTFCIHAQTVFEPIEILEKGSFKKKVYKRCGIEMTPTQLITLLREDPAMEDYVKPVASNYIAKLLLGTAASVLIAIPVVDSFSSSEESDPNWNLAYIGAGCALLSIPFDRWFKKNADKAVNYYNSGYQSNNKSSPQLEFQLGSNGLGLLLEF